jgi:hypothetical protein
MVLVLSSQVNWSAKEIAGLEPLPPALRRDYAVVGQGLVGAGSTQNLKAVNR